MTPFKTAGIGEFENQMRMAFRGALERTADHTKLSGVVYRSLCSKAGITNIYNYPTR